MQYQAYKQFFDLKAYANKNGIKIIGDIPIYVSYDSSDVWMKPELFLLDENIKPTFVAGVPPDSFSAEGQLWGNPLYNWDNHQKDNYNWWVSRIKKQLKMFNYIRIDHFIGFVRFLKIKADALNAKNGVWDRAHGKQLFDVIKKELGEINVIAEDLGVITDEVRELLQITGYPGTKVLQFAFDSDDSEYLPHHYDVNSVAYTGTHDNMTTRTWFDKLNKAELSLVKNYINVEHKKDYVASFIKEVLKSKSFIAVIPMQDYLDLDDKARMNFPSTLGDNWCWRLSEKDLTQKLIMKIKQLTKLSYRNNLFKII